MSRTGIFAVIVCIFSVFSVGAAEFPSDTFPPPLDSYPSGGSIWDVLRARIEAEPFNLIATILFVLAIVHTFLAPMFLRLSHRVEHAHRERLRREGKANRKDKEEVSFAAQLLHFLGEVEAVFGIWSVPLLMVIAGSKHWTVARDYFAHHLTFTEPMFVVVIMTISASRPILKLTERIMALFARVGGGTAAAWWFSILTVGPLLGSFITEPAAMTISALLLAEKFYERKPSPKLAYATLGLLFVNVSVGGTLTHFAAPPVLMVADKWGWGMREMLLQFGWKAIAGVVAANMVYLLFFRRALQTLPVPEPPLNVEMIQPKRHDVDVEPVPIWITVVHLLALAWTIINNHYPVLFIGGFLFYLAFTQATQHHQFVLNLRPPLLVGFFLAGLVVHGGLQGWWIQPVLTRLSEVPLFIGATILTAFNDNAAITYLASLVPSFSPALKYAVVAGAVTGGGLTVIANAPNPAGQSILSEYFPNGVSPLYLFLGAAIPTSLVAVVFMVFR